jgi:ABC-2 type transport system permease protein
MPGAKRTSRYILFALTLVALVLANVASTTLFMRHDLTANGVYSLSKASRRVVESLSEPLTIHVFFTRNLPAPYNGVERYLRDLFEEYAVFANRHFNYRFYDVSAEEGDITPEARENQKIANAYGIHPIQIQAIEKDEVKFQRAYMGMVMIHGDLIEQIPTVTATEGLEYRITTAIQKMNNKIGALLGLRDKILVELVQSSTLNAVAPLVGLKQLPELPAQVEQTVQELNAKHYGKLEYRRVTPDAEADIEEVSRKFNLLALSWPASSDGRLAAGRGVIGMVLTQGERQITLPVLEAIRIPILGTQYKLAGPEDVERMVSQGVESLIDIHADLGYLADHRTVRLTPAGMPGGGPEDQEALTNFREMVSQSYSLKSIPLAEQSLPENIACLVIAKPREPFSDYALYQIDQFLMQGKSLAVFLDPYEEVPQAGQPSPLGGRSSLFKPISTGLEKLLEHYGVQVKPAYVLDENCYRQEVPAQLGGGDRPLYFAPIIKNQNINKELPFLKNIKGLVAVKAAPVETLADRLRESGLTSYPVIASSERSWEMRERISFDPMTLRPPANSEDMRSRTLACLIEGEFPSYFAGKPIPVKEAEARKEGEAPAQDAAPAAAPAIEHRGQFIAKGKPGRLFVMGSSEMLKNIVIDEAGRGNNSIFVMNVIDHLNQRTDVAVMRSKEQRFDPLRDTEAGTKTFVKSFNIIGLPLLTALFGLGVWSRRVARKRRIQAMFQ